MAQESTPLLLVVDDEANFRDIFSTKFSAAGFRVETASSGEEGIQKAKELKPDLILMDVKMPGIDGAQALMKLKEDPETKFLKVLFLTSLGDPSEDGQATNNRLAQDAGALGYLRKSDDLDATVAQVKAFLT